MRRFHTSYNTVDDVDKLGTHFKCNELSCVTDS